MSKNRSLNAAKRAQAGQKKKLKLSEKLSLSQKTLSATQKSTLQKKISQVTSRLKQKIKNSVFDPELFQQAGQLIKNCNQGDAANLLSQEFLRYYAVLALKDRQGELAIKQLMQLQQKQPSHPPLAITLAGLNGTLGNEEISKRYARKYATLKPVTPVKQKGKLNLLVLKTVASGKFRLVTKTGKYAIREGHNNLDALLDKNITKTIVRVDQPDAAIQAIRELPYKPDVVFNNITDAERCEKALQSAQRICDAFDFPVFNSPKAVLAASREGNYERFKDNPDILLPRSIKIPKTQQSAYSLIQEAILTQGFELPVIIRLAGYQGGKYMQKVDDLKTHDFTEMDAELKKYPQTVYLIQYHEVSCEDERLPDTRLYPKYRAFMVGGKLYPCHIFTASDFNVHKKNADPVMAANPWLIDKERHFCENPVEHLGKTQWLALEAAMRETGLDYNGVDFAVATSPENKGKLVVFEINPAMRNWVNQLPEGDHVQQAWARITQAAHATFAQHADVEPWAFVIPKGQSGGVLEIPDDVKCAEKKPLPDHAASNHRWLAERLGESNDFSDSPFFNTRYYIDEELLEHTARQQNIRVQRYPGRMLEFTQGDQQVVFHINAPRIPMDVHLLENDKVLVKQLFKQHGIPTPAGEAFTEFEAAYRYFAKQTRPQVVKPTNGFASRGVSVHITTPEAFQAAWQKAKQIGPTILVEDMIQGEELRVYFVNGQYMAATVRLAAFVLGDGQQTVAQLIEAKNTQRSANPATAKALITETPALERAGRTLSAVPEVGEWVVLGDLHMATAGAEYVAIGKHLPESMISACQQAAQLLPLQVCGVDVFVENFSQPDAFWITELNASTPAIAALFHYPRFGDTTGIAPQLLEYALEHLAIPTTAPESLAIQPAPVFKGKLQAGSDAAALAQRLLVLAQEAKLAVQQLDDTSLLLGEPVFWGLTQGLSTDSPMESLKLLKDKAWLQERMQALNLPLQPQPQLPVLRLWIAGEQLIAAQRLEGTRWQDVTEELHTGMGAVAASLWHLLYRPGHLLAEIQIADHQKDPKSQSWSVQNLRLQAPWLDLYQNTTQPRDPAAAILAHALKRQVNR